MGENRDGKKSPRVVLTLGTKVLLLSVAAVLSVPGAFGLLTDHEARSRWEKRSLEVLPGWPGVLESSSYFAALSRFADDHVGFALAVSRFVRRTRFYVLADDPAVNISVGKDGFVFLNSHLPERPFDVFEFLCVKGANEARYEHMALEVESTFEWFESRGYMPSLGIAVTKPVLYPENLPGRVPAKYRDACRTFGSRPSIPRRLAALGRNSGRVIHYPFDEFMLQRAKPAFYPKECFHWYGLSAHVFARGLLAQLGIQAGPEFEEGATLDTVPADMHSFTGFGRRVTAWRFPYRAYGLEQRPGEPKMIVEYYRRARVEDFSTWTSATPLTDRSALLISNSFGENVAEHLAPGFERLIHVNVNRLERREWDDFFGRLVDQLGVTDVIFVLQDAAVAKAQFFRAVGRRGLARSDLGWDWVELGRQ
jgi:hypothetical protein